MQIYECLKRDHQIVKGLLQELLSLEDEDEGREDLIEQIRDELVPHARAEEAVFYNALRALDADRSELMHGYKEHLEAETLLRTLQAKDKIDADWKATATKLKEALEHHISEEEGTIFSIARSMLTEEEAEKIGAAFERLKPEVEDQNFVQTSMKLVANLMPPRLSKTVLSETRPST